MRIAAHVGFGLVLLWLCAWIVLAASRVLAQAPAPLESSAAPPPQDAPLTPAEALASFRLEPGLRIELVAAEPLVESPVAMAFDERGRMFVVENRGYPTGPGEGQPPAGRVAILEDTDGDGTFDKRTEFADGLDFPNGVLPWKGGAIVTCAPDILFLEDTDGDGRADRRRVLFSGFSTAGSTQLRVSHPTLGIDNWIYATSGLTGGKVVSPDWPGRAAVELGRTDFRFRPDSDRFEAADGGAQFGLSFDDFGRRFICYNRVQVQHVVLASRYLRRNPHLAFSETVQNCPAEMLPEQLPGHAASARLYPISQNITTADSHAGTFTAACGVLVFRGDGLPDEYRGGAFSCEPTGNLVHFDRLEQQGATFTARRTRPNSEFLASTDNWFRPVFLAHGPDGAIYICDMYRRTIEHPDYLPAEIRKHTDFKGGKGMGRIYRVVRDGATAAELKARRKVDLSHATVAELCSALGHADGWWRDTAQRLLLERRDKWSVGALMKIAAARGASPAAAARALWLLDAMDVVDDATLLSGLSHPAAGVREPAVQLAEPRLANSPRLAARVLELAGDPDPRVRFHCALALGATDDSRSIARLAEIALADSRDRWLRAAVFSSVNGREVKLLQAILTQSSPAAEADPELFVELGRLLGASQPAAERAALVDMMAERGKALGFERQAMLLAGLAAAVRQHGLAGTADSALAQLSATDDGSHGAGRQFIGELVAAALEIAKNRDELARRRVIALTLLAQSNFATAGATLLALVDPDESMEVQSGAIRALGTMHDDAISARLLARDRFPNYSPALREEVLSAMLSNPGHLPGLFMALEDGAIPAGAIDSLRRRQLTEHRDPAIRGHAAKFFSAATGDRAQVYDDYKSVLQLKPESDNGRQVFKKECANCHRLDRDGVPVGPDLFGIRNQPKEAILLHILIPEYEIAPGFAAYVVELKDGRVLTGLIAAESGTSITLRQALGKEETVLREDIERLTASKLSLMPQELERTMSRQELADLLAYLKGEQNQ